MKEKELVLFMESVHISPVADPGGGARKAPPPPPFILTLKTEWPKKMFFGDQPHPPYLGVWNDRAPPPPPPYLKVWIRRCSPRTFLCAHEES